MKFGRTTSQRLFDTLPTLRAWREQVFCTISVFLPWFPLDAIRGGDCDLAPKFLVIILLHYICFCALQFITLSFTPLPEYAQDSAAGLTSAPTRQRENPGHVLLEKRLE